MSDIQLIQNYNTINDVNIVNGDLVMTENKSLQDIIQRLTIKFQWFYGEWFANALLGLKIHETIFVKNPDIDLIANNYKAFILDEPDIEKIESFGIDIDQRIIKLKFVAQLEYGTLLNYDGDIKV